MKLFKPIALSFVLTDCIVATETPKDIFYETVEIFHNATKINHYQFMDHLQTLNYTKQCDKLCKENIENIVVANYRVSGLIAEQSKTHQLNSIILKKFVMTYIKHHLHNDVDINIRLNKTLFALQAQEDTIKLVTKSKLIDLLKFVKQSLVEFKIVEDEKFNSMGPAEDEKYLMDSIITFVKGTFFFMLCYSISSMVCMGFVGALLLIQVVIWILTLIRYILTGA
ncbi:uncharacterized protein KABA2_03S00836 [Maudiozyma barnettii]|uniref:Protein BIG1 n=1 Tax=Maudiozyma barnettii TaxID=61262 RepID=A0A8H2VDN9_9SACH|nr:hypothetical protein, no similarity [Kazachstania barnettii]CAB4253540.1 hypothetical protein, no similarity [Kazachstania barnettii]